MKIKKYKNIMFLALFSILLYVLHRIYFIIFDFDSIVFQSGLTLFYFIIWLMSTLLLTLLIKIKSKIFDSIGMLFMLGTLLQLVISYVLLRTVFDLEVNKASINKISFISVLFSFLIIETILTIRLLASKQ